MSKLRRVAELARRSREQGAREMVGRVVRRLSARLDVAALDFPLLPGDIADSTRLGRPAAAGATSSDDRLTIGWVCTPPGRGSGGHTTLFRMVEALEQRGHRCILYLYDRHGGDLARQTAVIRENWPQLKAEVRQASVSLEGADAYVASSWDTAHVLASRAAVPGARLYFIQDYEALFYPKGTLSALAEDSYRFGFRNIALGDMVARNLDRRGIAHDTVPFGCDTDVYHLADQPRPRSGVVFYTKPGSDRRGYLLGRLALEDFHRRHPEEPIHLYGDASDEWDIPTIQHGKLSPAELNDLYNSAKAGLAISFTNVSLVAEEMLAAGMNPIVTDEPDVRSDLPNENAYWALPTPGGLSDALSAAVTAPDSLEHRAAIAASVRHGWGPAQDGVAEIIVDEVSAVRSV